jgi:SAM-dependent methyltransferase
VAFEVIEHLPGWRDYLLEVRRVLAPAGQFIVSTPNKLYYAESRSGAGANPFHAHEFEFDEFRRELSAIFPHVSLFLENHVEGIAFRPVCEGGAGDAAGTDEVRVDGGETPPTESHFFVAVCGHRPQTGNSTFVYVPSAANVLRERETHIALLEGELQRKDQWLESAQRDLADLDRAHRKLTAELEESNRWAAELDRELAAGAARIHQLQDEMAAAQAAAQAKIEELDRENRAKSEWGRQLDAQLAQCVEYLHQAETTVEERTRWAQRLDAEVEQLRRKLALLEASRWVRLGRSVGLGPDADPQ